MCSSDLITVSLQLRDECWIEQIWTGYWCKLFLSSPPALFSWWKTGADFVHSSNCRCCHSMIQCFGVPIPTHANKALAGIQRVHLMSFGSNQIPIPQTIMAGEGHHTTVLTMTILRPNHGTWNLVPISRSDSKFSIDTIPGGSWWKDCPTLSTQCISEYRWTIPLFNLGALKESLLDRAEPRPTAQLTADPNRISLHLYARTSTLKTNIHNIIYIYIYR